MSASCAIERKELDGRRPLLRRPNEGTSVKPAAAYERRRQQHNPDLRSQVSDRIVSHRELDALESRLRSSKLWTKGAGQAGCGAPVSSTAATRCTAEGDSWRAHAGTQCSISGSGRRQTAMKQRRGETITLPGDSRKWKMRCGRGCREDRKE